MTDAGLIVIAAFVSPFRADRETARSLFDEGEFVEVFVDLPAELAAERDTTGLYAKAQTPASSSTSPASTRRTSRPRSRTSTST